MLAALPLFALASVFACGTDDGSGFVDGDAGDQSSGASGTSGTSGASGTSGISSGGSPDGSNGGTGDGGACNATVARAEKLPVQMLVLLDRSGSMGDHDGANGGAGHTNNATRWTPITTALEGFLADPSSAGIQASLRYFPKASNKAENNPGNDIPANVTLNCSKTSYATPDIPLTPLPNAATFTFADNATFFGTPTLAALPSSPRRSRRSAGSR